MGINGIIMMGGIEMNEIDDYIVRLKKMEEQHYPELDHKDCGGLAEILEEQRDKILGLEADVVLRCERIEELEQELGMRLTPIQVFEGTEWAISEHKERIKELEDELFGQGCALDAIKTQLVRRDVRVEELEADNNELGSLLVDKQKGVEDNKIKYADFLNDPFFTGEPEEVNESEEMVPYRNCPDRGYPKEEGLEEVTKEKDGFRIGDEVVHQSGYWHGKIIKTHQLGKWRIVIVRTHIEPDILDDYSTVEECKLVNGESDACPECGHYRECFPEEGVEEMSDNEVWDELKDVKKMSEMIKEVRGESD